MPSLPVLKYLVFVWFCAFALQGVFAQIPGGDLRNAVSSDAFLSGLPPTSFAQNAGVSDFPAIAKESKKVVSEDQAVPVGYTSENADSRSQSVSTAQFDSPATPNAIGSGVANQPESLQTATSASNQSQPSAQAATKLDWRDRLGLDRNQPNFQVGYETIGFRRGNDSVGLYSQGQALDRFDQEVAGRYTFSRMLGGIERIEFKFTGPFHWEKQSLALGPVDSNFSSSIAPAFDQADEHRISHQVRMSSYELNRSWSSDELSTFFYGLRVFDHSERYRLEASKGASSSLFQLGTNNFLAGGQLGLNLSRPLSQRWTIGFDSGLGMYGNFASGTLDTRNGSVALLESSDSRFRVTTVMTTGGRLNYRVSQSIVATGAYEVWYFPGLATAADQHLSSNAELASLALRTGDDQLFRGWSVGLSARF